MYKKKKIVESLDYDEDFSYIAGYTSGGAPYGVTWEQIGISTDFPLEERVKLMTHDVEPEIINIMIPDFDEEAI